jgi:hypothetical protein
MISLSQGSLFSLLLLLLFYPATKGYRLHTKWKQGRDGWKGKWFPCFLAWACHFYQSDHFVPITHVTSHHHYLLPSSSSFFRTIYFLIHALHHHLTQDIIKRYLFCVLPRPFSFAGRPSFSGLKFDCRCGRQEIWQCIPFTPW